MTKGDKVISNRNPFSNVKKGRKYIVVFTPRPYGIVEKVTSKNVWVCLPDGNTINDKIIFWGLMPV